MAKQKPKSEWKKLPHQLTLAGLVLSLLFNVVQAYFLFRSNQRGDKQENLRKQQETRADKLLQDKEKWVSQLKAELLQVNQKIETDSIAIVRTQRKDGDPFVNTGDLDADLDKYQNDKEKQEKRRLDLIDEITYYMANDRQ